MGGTALGASGRSNNGLKLDVKTGKLSLWRLFPTFTFIKHIQGLLQPSTMLLGETGDAIFNCQKLALPDGCRYDWSQQYGSIGWSVGATLGLAMAGRDAGRRVLACIGDGSFQMTAQASELLRCRRDEATCQKGLALLTGALRGGHAVPSVLTWC